MQKRIELPNDIINLEKSIGYKFKDLSLLTEALTHPSLKQKRVKVKDYERLELLGDAVLGFLVTEILYFNFENVSEGMIARMKAHLVSKEVLSNVADSIGIADHILMTPGEESSGGRVNYSNLENATEALIAAVYLDGGIEVARKIVKDFWGGIIHNTNFDLVDPKGFLQELLQEKKLSPSYILKNREGPAHDPIFTVEVVAENYKSLGVGKSIKAAQKNAAENFIDKYKKIIKA